MKKDNVVEYEINKLVHYDEPIREKNKNFKMVSKTLSYFTVSMNR
jgi:hypothetical protein